MSFGHCSVSSSIFFGGLIIFRFMSKRCQSCQSFPFSVLVLGLGSSTIGSFIMSNSKVLFSKISTTRRSNEIFAVFKLTGHFTVKKVARSSRQQRQWQQATIFFLEILCRCRKNYIDIISYLFRKC
jgi:hypothetical protein